MKKYVLTAAIIVLCLAVAVAGLPATSLAAPPIRVVVDGRQLETDALPVIRAGRTLVPLRAIFEALGATVEWHGGSNKIVGFKGDKAVVLHIGSSIAKVDGVSVSLDVAPAIINGRTMVPTRFIAEVLGATVVWNETTRTVEITTFVAVESVSLSARNLMFRVGDLPVQLVAEIHPPKATERSVLWLSTDTTVAIVSSDGKVTPIAPGTCEVIATTVDGRRQAVCVVTVKRAVVAGIVLDKTELSLEVDNHAQLRATINPNAAAGLDLTWRTSDNSVLTVNDDGLVKGLTPGIAAVTVAATGSDVYATCLITVLPKVALTPTPAQFDLRRENALTPVNNQGGLGTCWAVALIDALESKIMLDSRELTDLSVYNMAVQASRAYASSFDRPHGGGAMAEVGLAYLTSWKGPVTEIADPYFDHDTEYRLRLNTRPIKLVQGATLFPNRRNAVDNELYKRHIMEHGAIYASMWKGTPSTYDRFYNQETFAWYYPHDHLTPEGNGHAVTIVGWDDHFPATNFNPQHRPPGNGAFIVRNTKGERWGSLIPGHNMGGYFYISYYDTKLGQTMYGYPNETGALGFTRVDDVGTYDFIYQHDMLGYNDQFLGAQRTLSMRNDFVVGKGHNERLSAVSFYTLQKNVQYEIWLHRGVTGANAYGSKTLVGRGFFLQPGYHTVDLREEVPLRLRERIGIEIKLSASDRVRFAIDSATGYLSKGSEARPDTSFVAESGKWVDLHTLTANGKACIKIFTRDSGPDTQHMLSPQAMRAELDAFVSNLRTKQSEFLNGFTPEHMRVIQSAYEEINSPLSAREFELLLNRILAMAGDGHARVFVPSARALQRGGLAVEFVWLHDGLFVLDDMGSLRKGDRIVKVGHLDNEALMTTMRKTFPTENIHWVKGNTNSLLRSEVFLREYGVVNQNNTVDLLVERSDRQFVVQPLVDPVFRASRSPSRTFYEFRVERENNLGYMKFNYWPDDKDPDRAFFLVLADAVHTFFAQVKLQGIQNIVIDVRENNGGFVAIQYLLGEYTVVGGLPGRRPEIKMRDEANFFTGNVYYLQGYSSFSLSVNAATVFKQTKRIIVIGEESGQRPNFNHGSTFHNLIHVTGNYRLSSNTPPLRSFQRPGDDTIHPDILIRRSIRDVLASRDIQLERLRQITRGGTYVYCLDAVEVPAGGKIPLSEGHRFSVLGSTTVILPFQLSQISKEGVWFEQTSTRKRTSAGVEWAAGTASIDARGLEIGTHHLLIKYETKIHAVLVSVIPSAAAESEQNVRSLKVVSSSGMSLTRWNYYMVSFDRSLSPQLDASKVSLVDSQGKAHPFHLERPSTEKITLLIVIRGTLPPGRYTITLQTGAVRCEQDSTLTNSPLNFTVIVN